MDDQDGIQTQSLDFQGFQSYPAFDFTNYTNGGLLAESIPHRMASLRNLADGTPPYQVTETMFQAPLPGPSRTPHYPDPQSHSQVLQTPSRIDAVEWTTTPPYFASHAADISPSFLAPSSIRDIAGNDTIVPPLLLSPTFLTANEVSATPPSNAILVCRWSSTCNAMLDGAYQGVRNHLKRKHQFGGIPKESIQCLWAGCEQTLQRENIPRHIVTCHPQMKVSCAGCGKSFSRPNAKNSHAPVCPAKDHTSSSRLRTGVPSQSPRSMISSGSNPFLSRRPSLPWRVHGVVPGFAIHPHPPSSMETTPGWASDTIPIQTTANTTGSSSYPMSYSFIPAAGVGASPFA